MNIDVAFDFTSDTPNYWNNFWYDGVLGGGGADPDAVSKTLQTYHQFLWSKSLPNGEQMNLSMGKGYDYLSWKNFRFGSDSILTSFRYSDIENCWKKFRKQFQTIRALLKILYIELIPLVGVLFFQKKIVSIEHEVLIRLSKIGGI